MVSDTVQGADAEKGSRGKQNDNHTMVDDDKQDGTESPALIIGGENGANTVIAARLAGLVPVEEVTGSSNVAGQVILSKEEFWKLKVQRQKEDGEDAEQELPKDVSLAEMGRIVEMWLVSSKVMPRCNVEHRVAIVECVLSLASSFCNQQVPDFSMVIQGSGGTGKTKSVIMGVKEFVDQVCRNRL